MRFPVPQISISVLVMHLVLGCCWHHAHCYEAHGSDQSVGRGPGTVVAACGCSDIHDSESNDSDPSDSDPSDQSSHSHDDPARPESGNPAGSHHCGGDSCSFLRSQRLTEQQAEFCDQPSRLVNGPNGLNLPDDNMLLAQVLRFEIRPPDAGPPIRRHLMLQILVI